jgi:hypothetical protein
MAQRCSATERLAAGSAGKDRKFFVTAANIWQIFARQLAPMIGSDSGMSAGPPLPSNRRELIHGL